METEETGPLKDTVVESVKLLEVEMMLMLVLVLVLVLATWSAQLKSMMAVKLQLGMVKLVTMQVVRSFRSR